MQDQTKQHLLSMTLPKRPLIAAAAALIACSPAAAQTDYEYEADEGWHAEEWYDPSDWFDDEYYDYYTNSYAVDSDAYQAYWDGYYDGYYDDTYGYDYWDNDWNAAYSSLYTDGYYDGYYDGNADYTYDPIYYVYSYYMPADSGGRSEDSSRSKGDRADSGGDSDSQKAAAKDAEKKTRVRGNLTGMAELKKSQKKIAEHTVIRLSFDDGSEAVVDFGPKAKLKDLPLTKGERVSISGDKVKRNDRAVIVANSISADGKVMNLRDGKKS